MKKLPIIYCGAACLLLAWCAASSDNPPFDEEDEIIAAFEKQDTVHPLELLVLSIAHMGEDFKTVALEKQALDDPESAEGLFILQAMGTYRFFDAAFANGADDSRFPNASDVNLQAAAKRCLKVISRYPGNMIDDLTLEELESNTDFMTLQWQLAIEQKEWRRLLGDDHDALVGEWLERAFALESKIPPSPMMPEIPAAPAFVQKNVTQFYLGKKDSKN